MQCANDKIDFITLFFEQNTWMQSEKAQCFERNFVAHPNSFLFLSVYISMLCFDGTEWYITHYITHSVWLTYSTVSTRGEYLFIYFVFIFEKQ